MKYLVLACLAVAVAHAAVHTPADLCCGWSRSDLVSVGDDVVKFHITLKNPTGMAQIKAIAESVSDPTSSGYGAFLSQDKISLLSMPAGEDLTVVTSWLKAERIPFSISPQGDVHAECPMSTAARVFATEFTHLENSATKQSVVRAGAFSLPAEVEAVTAAVFGLHGLPVPPRKPVGSKIPQPGPVTPTVIAQSYSISGVKPRNSEDNKQAVAEFQGQFVLNTDLVTFFEKEVPSAQPGDSNYTVMGDKDQQSPGIEASLDIQFIMGIAPHLKTELWLQNNQDFCGDLKNWTDLMLATKNLANVHSISYGWQGNLAQLQCTDDKVKAVDNNFVKLAAQGVSVIFASGDSGSGYQGTQTNNNALPQLWPSWPASSQWVTSVGATRFENQKSGTEMASDQFGSGGGFSTMFDQPTYQQAAVQHYVQHPPTDKAYPPKGSFPVNGRATPDVSGLGEGYMVYTGGQVQPVGGTSASTPMFAAVVSLLNEARIQKGMKPLGFLNHFIYQNADAFTDIVNGTNAIGRGTGPIKYGFACQAGWDPATGLGTPIFPKLLAAALKAKSL